MKNGCSGAALTTGVHCYTTLGGVAGRCFADKGRRRVRCVAQWLFDRCYCVPAALITRLFGKHGDGLTQRWESRALVPEVRWRRLALRCLVHVTRASWQIVLDSWHQDSSRIAQTECTHLPELLIHRANQWASMDVCDRKRGGCGAIMNYVHSAASIAHKEAKSRMKGKKKEVTTISQRAACPRCDRELYVFNTASGPILRCRGWTLAGTPCTLIKACHNGVIVPGGLQNTNRTGGGNSASGSGGPGTLPRRDDGIQNPPLLNDWTAHVQA